MTDKNPFPVDTERRLAIAIEDLRNELDWSYGELSRRMGDAGCPMDRSSLQKIEKGNPRRKITVNELVAFAQVFNVPVGSLLHTSEDVALLLAWRDLMNAESLANVLRTASGEYERHVMELGNLALKNGPFREQVQKRFNEHRRLALKAARKQAATDGYDVSTDEGLQDYLHVWDYETPVTRTAKDVLRIKGRLGVDDGE